MCLCMRRNHFFAHVHVQFKEMLFPKPRSTFLWNRATRVKCETRSSDIPSKRTRSSAPVGTFLRAPFPLVPHCWKRCAWNNCGSVWHRGARKPLFIHNILAVCQSLDFKLFRNWLVEVWLNGTVQLSTAQPFLPVDLSNEISIFASYSENGWEPERRPVVAVCAQTCKWWEPDVRRSAEPETSRCG